MLVAGARRVAAGIRPRIQRKTGSGARPEIERVYAVLDPQVGYCQGMNFVATLCLHVLPGGAGYDAFCLFAAMLLPEGPPGCAT